MGVGVLLVVEILVEAALGHAGGTDDAVDRRPDVGAGGEFGLEGLDDAGALVLGKVEEGGTGHENLL